MLEGDIVGIFARGDEASIAGLPAIARFLANSAPGDAFGDIETVSAWLNGAPRQIVRITLADADTLRWMLKRAIHEPEDASTDDVAAGRQLLGRLTEAIQRAERS